MCGEVADEEFFETTWDLYVRDVDCLSQSINSRSILALKRDSEYFQVIKHGRIYFAGVSLENESHIKSDEDDLRMIPFHELTASPYLEAFESHTVEGLLRFVKTMRQVEMSYPCSKIICCLDPSGENQIDGMFLMGCYMIFVHHRSPEAIWHSIKDSKPFNSHAPTHSLSGLCLLDMWKGFSRAQDLGWTDESYTAENYMRSMPLHVIIPGDLIAFGRARPPQPPLPTDITAPENYDADFYAEQLAKMSVSIVVRLSEWPGDDAVMEQRDLRCLPLLFDDPILPPSVVTAFAHAARTARGPVAVRCDSPRAGCAGLGLCALQLMRVHGFRAREAAAWTRLACPPRSVMCRPQLNYLCAVEAEYDAIAGPPRRPPRGALRHGRRPAASGSRAARAGRGAVAVGGDDEAAHAAAFQRAVYRVWRGSFSSRQGRGPRPQSLYGDEASRVPAAAAARHAGTAPASAPQFHGGDAGGGDALGCLRCADVGGMRPAADGRAALLLDEAAAQLCGLVVSLSGTVMAAAAAAAAAAAGRRAYCGRRAESPVACGSPLPSPLGPSSPALTRRPTLVFTMGMMQA
jgi:hypothetical protein